MEGEEEEGRERVGGCDGGRGGGRSGGQMESERGRLRVEGVGSRVYDLGEGGL